MADGNVNQGPGNGPGQFSEFLKSEYEHIAEAHFRSMETISSFFRHYLVIMSIPIALVAALLTVTLGNNEIVETVEQFSPLLAAILFAISFAGVGVLAYITSLRLDMLLYARTVNAIRKHFYDRSGMELQVQLRTRILPQTAHQPAYSERRFFLPVVLCFGLLDATYLFFGLVACYLATGRSFDAITWPIWFGLAAAAVFFLLCHVIVYQSYARHREKAYLKSNWLGIDIDGVINRHRTHFCVLLESKVGKVVNEEDITVVPCHECPALNISRDDEIRVFNDPKYWTDMPPVKHAKENLARLRSELNLRLHVFSHRPWPQFEGLASQERENLAHVWREESRQFFFRGKIARWSDLLTLARDLSTLAMLRSGRRAVIGGVRPINIITRSWLRRHGFEYDALTIEDSRARTRNRFDICGEKNVKFFVEDQIEKAEKLAYICDVVFLFDQPYNRTEGELPGNIVRVMSWDQIYKELRRLT